MFVEELQSSIHYRRSENQNLLLGSHSQDLEEGRVINSGLKCHIEILRQLAFYVSLSAIWVNIL